MIARELTALAVILLVVTEATCGADLNPFNVRDCPGNLVAIAVFADLLFPVALLVVGAGTRVESLPCGV